MCRFEPFSQSRRRQTLRTWVFRLSLGVSVMLAFLMVMLMLAWFLNVFFNSVFLAGG